MFGIERISALGVDGEGMRRTDTRPIALGGMHGFDAVQQAAQGQVVNHDAALRFGEAAQRSKPLHGAGVAVEADSLRDDEVLVFGLNLPA